MTTLAVISLSPQERTVICEALSAYAASKRRKSRAIVALLHKIQSNSYPKVTIGVQGGIVQWASGNAFPIRICDYDGEGSQPQDKDEKGRRCAITFEPPDTSADAGGYHSDR